MGEALADQVRRSFGDDMDIDVVIPVSWEQEYMLDRKLTSFKQVPDTSRVAAIQLSRKLNIVYREGFNKNRYVGRTFIMPGQQTR